MKLRNKLIATIVSISMVLAVIGVGAWASTESFTATITNTVNLEFDNLKGQIIVEARSGTDSLDQADAPYLPQTVMYDGSNVIYNQISSSATSGTNLYWEGTSFMDGSEDGLQLVDNKTEAASFGYAFFYTKTEDCSGTSTITIMVDEQSAPEISGGKLMIKYFASTNGSYWAEIFDGVPITPIDDTEFVAVMAVCQYYNLDGESISTVASAWDFEIVFSAGNAAKTTLTENIPIDVNESSNGVLLPYDYQSDVVNALAITSAAGLEVNGLAGSVSVMGQSGADNLETANEPYLQETVAYDGTNLLYGQIGSAKTRSASLNWEGANFLDTTAAGSNHVGSETKMAVFGYTFTYAPTANCDGTKTITINIQETSRPTILGGQLTVKYFATTDGQYWDELQVGSNITPIADNEAVVVGAVCQFYNFNGIEVATVTSAWNFNVSFSAGTYTKTPLDKDAVLNINGASSGALLPYENNGDFGYDWELIEFGEYPQTLKASNVNIVSQTPDANGYYLGSDGERYVAHTISETVNLWAGVGQQALDALALITAADGTKMKLGQTYYFKVEPIKWRVLKESNGQAFVVADKVLAAQYYHAEYGFWSSHPDAPDGTPANNYQYSDLRDYLIGDFYNKSFSVAEKESIILTNVDNSAATTNDPSCTSNCENTNDYVFTLSYQDITNPEYGFNSDPEAYDTARCWGATDYAKATGALVDTSESIILNGGQRIDRLPFAGYCAVWTRSPLLHPDGTEDNNRFAWVADLYAHSGIIDHTDGNWAGFAPAMNITR